MAKNKDDVDSEWRWPRCPDCDGTDIARQTEVIPLSETFAPAMVKALRQAGLYDSEVWHCTCLDCGTAFATTPSISCESVEVIEGDDDQ